MKNANGEVLYAFQFIDRAGFLFTIYARNYTEACFIAREQMSA